MSGAGSQQGSSRVAVFNQFCTRIFSIRIIQYRLNVNLYSGVTAGKVSRFDNVYLRFGSIYTDLVRFIRFGN